MSFFASKCFHFRILPAETVSSPSAKYSPSYMHPLAGHWSNRMHDLACLTSPFGHKQPALQVALA